MCRRAACDALRSGLRRQCALGDQGPSVMLSFSQTSRRAGDTDARRRRWVPSHSPRSSVIWSYVVLFARRAAPGAFFAPLSSIAFGRREMPEMNRSR